MIQKEFVYEKVLPLVKEKGRMLDYYLIKSLFENVDNELSNEFKKYQNDDLGFGNALEPDCQMPHSSNLATSHVIGIINRIKDHSIREEIIKGMVQYFESSFDYENERFYMITEESEQYPHAVWWNYEDLHKNFTYGNPEPEIIGFMFKYRRFLTDFPINKQVNKVVNYILSDQFLEDGMHNLFSVLKFHKLVDQDVKNLIHDRIHELANKLLNQKVNPDEYGLEPYKVYIIDHHYVIGHDAYLNENLEQLKKQVEELSVMPNWKWYQNDAFFEETAKYQWMGHIYFEKIKALRLHREL